MGLFSGGYSVVLLSVCYVLQEERLLRMGDELSRLASYEAECHRKDVVIAALRDEVADLKGALQSNGGFRYTTLHTA